MCGAEGFPAAETIAEGPCVALDYRRIHSLIFEAASKEEEENRHKNNPLNVVYFFECGTVEQNLKSIFEIY